MAPVFARRAYTRTTPVPLHSQQNFQVCESSPVSKDLVFYPVARAPKCKFAARSLAGCFSCALAGLLTHYCCNAVSAFSGFALTCCGVGSCEPFHPPPRASMSCTEAITRWISIWARICWAASRVFCSMTTSM